jgi:hypothetical protein
MSRLSKGLKGMLIAYAVQQGKKRLLPIVLKKLRKR